MLDSDELFAVWDAFTKELQKRGFPGSEIAIQALSAGIALWHNSGGNKEDFITFVNRLWRQVEETASKNKPAKREPPKKKVLMN